MFIFYSSWIRYYWSKKYKHPIISQTMTRNRFFAIRSNLKVIDDKVVTSKEKQDKLWKVRPLLNNIHKRCLEIDRPGDEPALTNK